MLKGTGEVPSLLDTVTALANSHRRQGSLQERPFADRFPARRANWTEDGAVDTAMEEIHLGGILHDIGKIHTVRRRC